MARWDQQDFSGAQPFKHGGPPNLLEAKVVDDPNGPGWRMQIGIIYTQPGAAASDVAIHLLSPDAAEGLSRALQQFADAARAKGQPG